MPGMSSHQTGPTATPRVPTSTAHPGIERASEHLAAVLVGNGDVDAVLTASEVILRLAEVTPPLPPLTYPATGPSDLPGIRAAVTAAAEQLSVVVDSGEDLEEALRAGHGARLLHELLGRLPQDDDGDQADGSDGTGEWS